MPDAEPLAVLGPGLPLDVDQQRHHAADRPGQFKRVVNELVQFLPYGGFVTIAVTPAGSWVSIRKSRRPSP